MWVHQCCQAKGLEYRHAYELNPKLVCRYIYASPFETTAPHVLSDLSEAVGQVMFEEVDVKRGEVPEKRSSRHP